MQRWTRPLLAEPDRVILSHVWTTSTCYKPREIERGVFRTKTVHRGHNGTESGVRHIVWCRCAGPRRFSHDSRDIASGSMSSASPPDDKAIALWRSMTLHHRDVQQNRS